MKPKKGADHREDVVHSEKNSLLDYVAVLVKWRWMIVLSFVCVCVAAVLVSLMLPKAYTARAVILPPEMETPPMGLSGLLAEGPVSLTRIVARSMPAEVFGVILRSRTVADAVITRFDLVREYRVSSREEAILRLKDHLQVRLSREGATTVEVEASRAQLAAALANALVEELDQINRRQKSMKAGDLRRFVGERLEEIKADLARAEERLRDFQREHLSVDLTEQTRVAIEGAATLQAELIKHEITLGVVKRYMAASNPQLTPLVSRIAELKKQIAKLASEGSDRSDAAALYIPLENVPEMGIELARRMRELKVQETLFEYLVQEHEQAKIEEAKNTPTIQVLDWASVPVFRSKPRRRMIVLISGGLSLALSIFLAFVFEGMSHWPAEEQEKLRGIGAALRRDLRKVGIGRKG